MFHPSRGGVRGGKDQFNWEDVKEDKHRENYLGHSLMAPVGRWQKGKDLQWYAKEGKEEKKLKEKSEIAKIKEAEAEAMAIALGFRKKKTLESHVTADDLKHALKRDDEDEEDDKALQSTEKGLGYGRSNRLQIPSGSNAVEVMNVANRSYSTPSSTRNEDSRIKAGDNRNDDSDRDEHKKKKKKKEKSKDKKKRKHRHHDSDSDSEYEKEKKRSSRHSHDRHHRGRRSSREDHYRESNKRSRYD